MAEVFDIPLELDRGRDAVRPALRTKAEEGFVQRRRVVEGELLGWSLSWRRATPGMGRRLLELWDLTAFGSLAMTFQPPEAGSVDAGGLPLRTSTGTRVIGLSGSGRVRVRLAGGSGTIEIANSPDAAPPAGEFPVRLAAAAGTLLVPMLAGTTLESIDVRFVGPPIVRRRTATLVEMDCELEEAA